MSNFTVLYDALQEAEWFCNLHPALADARLVPISDAPDLPAGSDVLSYDRPDIVLLDGENPILVVEETTEVPSGHNVGQRFARVVAAAEVGVPVLYFGPYVAMKHGGETAGPRYVNARLFQALEAVQRMTGTTVTAINWPVNENSEVLRGPAKDSDVREYIKTFLEVYDRVQELNIVNEVLGQTEIHLRMLRERETFTATSIRNPEQYNSPPTLRSDHDSSRVSASLRADRWGISGRRQVGRL